LATKIFRLTFSPDRFDPYGDLSPKMGDFVP